MLYFTYSIIAITVITSFIGFQSKNLLEKYLFSVREILQGKEIHRLITANFIHTGSAHLLFNMFSLYSFAVGIEMKFGPGLIAVIYICSALGGDLLALILKRNEPDYKALGASGAVCGVIFASVFLIPGGSIYIMFIPIAIPAWLFSIFFIFISIYGIGRGSSRIGHDAHLGGAIIGIACAVLYNPEIIYTEYKILIILTVPVVILLVLSFVKPEILHFKRKDG